MCLFPDLDKEIANLKQKGVRLLGYITPHIHKDGGLFGEAEASGYFVKTTDGDTYLTDFGEFLCGNIDLTNLEAVRWYKGL